MELISRAPKAILRVETLSELAIASVIDYVLPPPVPEKVLEVMRSVKWSIKIRYASFPPGRKQRAQDRRRSPSRRV